MDTNASQVRGNTAAPLIEEPIGALLDRSVARWPETELLVSVEQSIRYTYAEFARRADDLAEGLLGLGLVRGDRVGILAPNCAEWMLTQFATARTGLIQVNINPAYRLTELDYTLNKVGVKALIAAESFKTSDYLAMLETLAPEIPGSAPGALEAARLPALSTLITLGGPRPGWLEFAGIPDTRRARLPAAAAEVDAHQPINIQFTSGTTGLPKGATLSHRNIVNNAWFVGASTGLVPGDRLCVPVPLYHCFGMVMSNLACVLHGATIVYPSAGFDPLAVLQAVQNERCTALHGVPTMFIAELQHPRFEEFDMSTLRAGIMAGSPCPVEVMRRVVERMHMREVTIAYGMTETSPVSFQSSPHDSLERRVTTVGRIQPHMEAKIIDDRRANRAARGAGRALLTRLRRHARLLGRSRTHRRGDRRGGLDAHRRPRGDRRRGLLQHRRTEQGHDHPRWRERVPPRDRGVPVPPPQGRGCGSGRGP